MSHAMGKVRFPDGSVLHFEYDGTADVAISALWDTPEQVQAHWRGSVRNTCVCGHDEPVRLFTDYGDGSHWAGRACRACKAITAGGLPAELDTEDGVPDWANASEVES